MSTGCSLQAQETFSPAASVSRLCQKLPSYSRSVKAGRNTYGKLAVHRFDSLLTLMKGTCVDPT